MTWEKIDNEGVFLDHRIGKIYKLNKTAFGIWEFLKTDKTLDDVIDFVNDKYKVKNKEADVKNILEEMVQLDLVSLKEIKKQ